MLLEDCCAWTLPLWFLPDGCNCCAVGVAWEEFPWPKLDLQEQTVAHSSNVRNRSRLLKLGRWCEVTR